MDDNQKRNDTKLPDSQQDPQYEEKIEEVVENESVLSEQQEHLTAFTDEEKNDLEAEGAIKQIEASKSYPSEEGKEKLSVKDRIRQLEVGKMTDGFKRIDWKAMNMNPMKSIGTRLFLIIFGSIVIFVLALGYFSYNTSKDVIEKKMAESTMQTLEQTSNLLDLLFEQYEAISMQIFMDQTIMDGIRQIQSDEVDQSKKAEISQRITETLTTYEFSNNSISGINLINLVNDQHISTLGHMSDLSKVKAAKWYDEVMNKSGAAVWLETKQTSYITGRTSTSGAKFALARLMKDSRNGQDMGILVMEINMSAISNQLKNLQMGDTGTVFMISKDKRYIQSIDNSLIEQAVDLDIDLNQPKHSSVETFNDTETLVVYHKSNETGWILVAEAPVHELVKETEQIRSITITMALLAMVVAVGIGILVMFMVSRPLVQLRQLMKEGENGNLTIRSDFKRKDEIGQLGHSFNEMMSKITELVRQVSDSASSVLNNAKELTDASVKTSSSAREISMATEEIAGGATTLATEAERGNDLTVNMGLKLKEVIEANAQMASSSSEVQQVSEQGIQYMEDLIHKTNSTEEMTRTMVEKVDHLKESTSSITQILEVLNDITRQTNILSLNATIEAARAGAAGKGFMVVADEIRKLADQSQNSISIVARITDKIQSEIVETVDVLSQAYPLFQEQIGSVKEADSIFKNVQSQMNDFVQQLDGVTESIYELENSQQTLSEAMSSVSAVSEQSSATSEEVASLCNEQLAISENLVKLSEHLEEMSIGLQQSLEKFKY